VLLLFTSQNHCGEPHTYIAAMRTKRFHGLKRLVSLVTVSLPWPHVLIANITPLQKFRQTWNKYNLYNLSRLRRPYVTPLTYFQQKWCAKSATRAYHGEQIREGQWERMFTSKIRSVIPMDHRYLAAHDGSEQAQGRGSGRDQVRPRNTKETIPYMQMTYAPIERRLDTAIFRALFASSTRQARQFVIHGAVKVNGKKVHQLGSLGSY
jgi:ribosomal protein S4